MGCADAAGATLRVQLLLAKTQLECVSIAELMLTVGEVAFVRSDETELYNSQQPSTVNLKPLTYRPCDAPFPQAAATTTPTQPSPSTRLITSRSQAFVDLPGPQDVTYYSSAPS